MKIISDFYCTSKYCQQKLFPKLCHANLLSSDLKRVHGLMQKFVDDKRQEIHTKCAKDIYKLFWASVKVENTYSLRHILYLCEKYIFYSYTENVKI